MPVVIRAETDMFRILPIYPDNILVNPANTVGAMGAGLALKFRELYPKMYKSYKQAHENGELQIGKLHIHHENEHTIIVNFFTKRHWMDTSEIDDIDKGLQEFRNFLITYPFYHVIMPALGTGLGKLDYQTVYPHIVKHLDDLPNIIHVCMDPKRLKREPRYLGIVGSRFFNDYNWFDLAVSECISCNWGLTNNYFDGLVSGGAQGVDTLAENYAKCFGIKPIIIEPDWDRYKKRAGFLRNMPIADIATYVIALPGKTSVGTSHTIAAVKKWNELHPDKPKVLEIIDLKTYGRKIVTKEPSYL